MSESKPPLAAPIPAFESALGIDTPSPVMVDPAALAKYNHNFATEDRAVMRFGTEAAQVASLFAKRAIRPDEIASLRRRMFDVVSTGLGEVEQVISGQKVWSPVQVRLFALLTERVMPKLSNITVEDNTTKKLDDMTIDELEAIALGKKKAGAIDAIEHKAEVLDHLAEKVERRETKKEVIRQLATIDAIDEAEKAYIAKKVATPMAELTKKSESGKIQPPPTDEQIKNLRGAALNRKSLYQRALDRGLTPEQAMEKERQRIEKIRITQQRYSDVSKERAARGMQLGDAVQVAKDIDKLRKQTMDGFRVHPLKGVRKQSTLTKEAEQRKLKREKRREIEENPRIYVKPSRLGITDEMLGGEKLRLRKLRQLRPDAFGDLAPNSETLTANSMEMGSNSEATPRDGDKNE